MGIVNIPLLRSVRKLIVSTIVEGGGSQFGSWNKNSGLNPMFLGLNTHGEVTGGEIQLRSRATESYVTFSLVN